MNAMGFVAALSALCFSLFMLFRLLKRSRRAARVIHVFILNVVLCIPVLQFLWPQMLVHAWVLITVAVLGLPGLAAIVVIQNHLL